jgi:hypothetical protein
MSIDDGFRKMLAGIKQADEGRDEVMRGLEEAQKGRRDLDGLDVHIHGLEDTVAELKTLILAQTQNLRTIRERLP